MLLLLSLCCTLNGAYFCLVQNLPPLSTLLQFLTGTQVQAAQIPYLPDAANILKAWFSTLPVSPSTYYIPGAIITATPVSINIDPATGASPSFGKGLIFALNPCTQEYHFGIQV